MWNTLIAWIKRLLHISIPVVAERPPDPQPGPRPIVMPPAKVEICERGTGCKVDPPDQNDYLFADIEPTHDTNRPKAWSGREYCGPVANQRGTGSCVGQATRNAGQYLLNRYYPNMKGTALSARYSYTNARKLEGPNGYKHDDGTFTRLGLLGAVKEGWAKEELWPFSQSGINLVPPNSVYIDGNKRELEGSYRVTGKTDAETLEQMKQAIWKGYAVIAGTVCYPTFNQNFVQAANWTIKYPPPTMRTTGSHCQFYYGFDDELDVLFGQGSWGTDWCDAGHFKQAQDYIRKGQFTDIWAAKPVIRQGKIDD